MNLKHLKSCLFLNLMHLPMRGTSRVLFARLAGIDAPKSPEFVFIGSGVVFDSYRPDLISIEDHVHITDGCILLTHYLEPVEGDIIWNFGKVCVKTGAFIGARTIITKPCTVGENSIVGAGSVVTKDIPANEIWGGNPAHFIKKR